MGEFAGLQAIETLTPVTRTRLASRVAGNKLLATVVLAMRGASGLPVLLRRSSLRDRILVLRAFGTLAIVEADLASGRAGVLLRRLRTYPAASGHGRLASRDARVVADHIVWAVSSVSVCFPDSRCLATASASFVLLRKAGVDVELVIGTTFDRSDDLVAHAWLEFDGEILFENPMKARIYRPLVRCRVAAAAPSGR